MHTVCIRRSVTLMGCRSGTGEYKTRSEKSQYTHYTKLDYTTSVIQKCNCINLIYKNRCEKNTLCELQRCVLRLCVKSGKRVSMCPAQYEGNA